MKILIEILDKTAYTVFEKESSGEEVCIMLAEVKGIVQGNTVLIDDDDIREYDGTEVVVTLLDYPQKKVKKAPVDWDGFVIPSERGKMLMNI